MIKKGLVVAVILLFIGTSIVPSISTAIEDKSCIATINDGNLSGYVNNTLMNPIQGARVRVHFHGTYEEDYTDSTGYYHVTNIPICYCLKNATASKVGYETEWILLSIVENTAHDFVLTSLEPVPDLDCEGSLDWVDIEPGETVTGTFTVENIGEEGSLLDWEIQSYPEWGTWTFDPNGGTGLPKGAPLTVCVEIVAPEDPETEIIGEIVLVNSDDPDDTCIIDIAIAPIINVKDKEINDDTTKPLDIGRFIVRGFGLFPRYSGENVTFFALRTSYIMINSTERTIGVCWLKRITLPRSTIVHVGPFNIVIYVCGTFRGNPFK